MNDQYIEPLISLINSNEDKTWLQAFLALRSGASLPGGGAGSLNDWGPVWTGMVETAWYSDLYGLLRYLFDNDLPPNRVEEYQGIKRRNSFLIIRCLQCQGSYQHPAVFESHIALEYFHQHFNRLAECDLLLNLLDPGCTFKSDAVIRYRQWLAEQYKVQDIRIFDFVKANYHCPHCLHSDAATVHDLYRITVERGQKLLQLSKRDAGWFDFF